MSMRCASNATSSASARSIIRARSPCESGPSSVLLSKRSLSLSHARSSGQSDQEGQPTVEEEKQSWQARRGWSWTSAALAAGCGALAFGLTSHGPSSAEALPGGSSDKSGQTALSAEQVKKQVIERLKSVSPAMPEILLPWSVEAEGKGTKLRISATPDSDLFCLLLTSVLQLTPPAAGGNHKQNEPRSLVGAVRIWDDEKTSTGISVSMGSGTLAVSLPWVGSATPELTVTSVSGIFAPPFPAHFPLDFQPLLTDLSSRKHAACPQTCTILTNSRLSTGAEGFTQEDVESLAKIIISANTSSRPSTASVDPLFDFFFSGSRLVPGVRSQHYSPMTRFTLDRQGNAKC